MNEYQIEETLNRRGFATLILHHNGKSVSLHSLNPAKEAQRVTSKFNAETEWVFIAGVGLGYLPNYLLEHSKHQLLLFEHISEFFQKLKKKWKNQPRIHLFSTIDDIIDFVSKAQITEMSLYFHRPYVQLFYSLYEELDGRLSALLSKRKINQATLYRFQKTWLTNLIKNSRFFHKTPGINTLSKFLKDLPSIIVGAGPSLQTAFPILKDNRNRYVLIAVDTALLPLQSAGIRPDFVVTMDPQDKNAQYLLYAKPQNFHLVMDASGHSLVFKNSQEKNFYMTDSIFPIYQELSNIWGEKKHLKSGGSVSTTAFSLALHLGCNPIILTGQDMAFSDSQIHTNGTILEEMLYYRIDRFHPYERYHATTTVFSDQIQISGWDRPKVATDRKFLTYLKWFEQEIQDTSASVYQTSTGGAYIKGAKHQSLDTILRNLPQIKIPNFPTTESVQENNLTKLEDVYRTIVNDINTLIPLMNKQLIEITQLKNAFSQNQRSQINNILNKLNENDRQLILRIKKKNLSSKFVELTMQKTIQDILNSVNASNLDLTLILRWQNLYTDFKEGLFYSRYRILKTLSLIKHITRPS